MIRDYKYFNDIYAFNVENYTWTKLDVSGTPPAPRSGCIMAAMPDSYRVTVYGGYSKEKVKRDVDKGTTQVDMTTLMPEGENKHKMVFLYQYFISHQDYPSEKSSRLSFRKVCQLTNIKLINNPSMEIKIFQFQV